MASRVCLINRNCLKELQEGIGYIRLQTVHFLKMSHSVTKTWSQNDFIRGERQSRSQKNGWLSDVNWLEGFSIKVRGATCFFEQLEHSREVKKE